MGETPEALTNDPKGTLRLIQDLVWSSHWESETLIGDVDGINGVLIKLEPFDDD